MAKRPILVADDDPHILELLIYNLEQAGYEVIAVRNGREALEAVRQYFPALVILDMLMPVLRGEEVCRRIKRTPATAAIPIIILSAISDEADKLLAFENGADDYVTKPFSIQELVMRVKALLRRTNTDCRDRPDLVSEGLVINVAACEARVDGVPMRLTRKEFELLRTLVELEGKILTRDFLLDRVWGCDFYGETRTVDVHIRHLRQKLGTRANRIQTIRNVGYRYQVGERDEGVGSSRSDADALK